MNSEIAGTVAKPKSVIGDSDTHPLCSIPHEFIHESHGLTALVKMESTKTSTMGGDWSARSKEELIGEAPHAYNPAYVVG